MLFFHKGTECQRKESIFLCITINLAVELYMLNSVVWHKRVLISGELNLRKGTLIF